MNFNVDIKFDGNELVKQLVELKLIQSIDSELAELVHDVFKCLRYVTPKVLSYVGSYVRKKVPEQNRTILDPRILKEVLENIAFITDEELHEMFLNLLASSCDSTKNNLAHPAYALLLSQLNKDEALIIKDLYSDVCLKNPNFKVREFSCEKIEDINIYKSSIEHLRYLGILNIGQWDSDGQITRDENMHKIVISALMTSFGIKFAQACIPSISSNSSSLA